ncbi:hypothetical protein GCM10010862_02020 [Devosia nitrariae]|uniref:Alpha 1,4-glycosyltransferase domain-containing protein n=2 Tax=Devosia nitrariae TaxID=2071872 RepID=A0ABQ5VYS0_9HYPH|nr:hypothetical protein GCM10010862_02020 [Devosia nitrariae]
MTAMDAQLHQAPSSLPVINMFWIGPQIGLIERLSMVSFLAAGHSVQLHAYDEVAGLPEGVTLVDADLTVERDYGLSLLGGRRGAPAILADYFRMALQLKGAGIWADADMLCVKPLTIVPHEPLFGLHSPQTINNAIVYLPPDSPIAADIIAGFAPNAIPKWLNFNRKRQLWTKRLIGQNIAPTDHFWTTFGPQALTELAKTYRVFDLAAPIDVFYPYNHHRAFEVLLPETDIAQFMTERTLCVHLWNNELKSVRDEQPASTSAIGRLLTAYGL